MITPTAPLKIDLQLFAEGDPEPSQSTVASLDSLLDGNTVNEPPAEPPTEPPTPEPNPGGDPNLEPSEPDAGTTEPPVDDGATDPTPPELSDEQRKQNAAFARMRTESAQANKLIDELSKALGIQETDPQKRQQQLLTIAQEKLAKDQNIPVELYQELNATKQDLAAMKQEQNMVKAQNKFGELASTYKLDQDQLYKFAEQLDEQGISVVEDPDVDLEYHYYKLNREAINKAQVEAAVQEALSKNNTADTHSTTPSKQSGKQQGTPAKINSVDALDGLLDEK